MFLPLTETPFVLLLGSKCHFCHLRSPSLDMFLIFNSNKQTLSPGSRHTQQTGIRVAGRPGTIQQPCLISSGQERLRAGIR